MPRIKDFYITLQTGKEEENFKYDDFFNTYSRPLCFHIGLYWTKKYKAKLDFNRVVFEDSFLNDSEKKIEINDSKVLVVNFKYFEKEKWDSLVSVGNEIEIQNYYIEILNKGFQIILNEFPELVEVLRNGILDFINNQYITQGTWIKKTNGKGIVAKIDYKMQFSLKRKSCFEAHILVEKNKKIIFDKKLNNSGLYDDFVLYYNFKGIEINSETKEVIIKDRIEVTHKFKFE